MGNCLVGWHSLKNKVEMSAYSILFIGAAFLSFTFVSAYIFLIEKLGILASSNPIEAFGEVLVPLIVAAIRVMYLGAMGWIGSILTMRGVQLFRQLKLEAKPRVDLPKKIRVLGERKETK